MTTTKFSISGADGLGIRGHVHRPASTNGAVPVLVFMHGFKGFQGWGPWAAVCDRFAENGVAAIRFDLSHNGVGDDGIAFSALDRFERNTIDAELFDLEAVLDWIGSGAVDVDPVAHEPLLPKLDPERVVLLGHSRGGGGILLGAAERLGLSPDAPPDRSRAWSRSVRRRARPAIRPDQSSMRTRWGALESMSACASVLMEMNSTPCSPSSIMRLTAF